MSEQDAHYYLQIWFVLETAKKKTENWTKNLTLYSDN